MRVMVTGGAGFIGSHVVEALVARGDDVVVFDNFDPSYDPSQKERNLAAVAGRIRLVRADVRDETSLAEALDGIDVVVHLAARAGVRASVADPRLYVKVNVEGTAALLETMRRVGPHRIVNVSSSSVYGARTIGPFLESDPLGVPASPYAASKQAAEALCDTWHHLHGFQVSTLRFFTVYGPRQRPDMAIHRFIRSILAGVPITLFGDGSSRRDYTYVADIVRGVVAAIDEPHARVVVNLGSSRPVSLHEMVRTIGDVLGRPVQVRWAPPQPGDAPMTWADTSLAHDLYGFEARTTLAEGLGAFVAWLAVQQGPPGTVDGV
jgi:UDP-glucuronate 4-epimerase